MSRPSRSTPWTAGAAVVALLALACDGTPTEDGPEAEEAGRTAAATAREATDTATEAARERVAQAAATEREEREPCTVPAIPIPRPRECVRGRDYPQCKWQMPHATLGEGRYRRWRNTIMEHWWGRPALVAFVLGATARYRERFPDQILAVGDLDAPGPRHRTHDNGVDVDIYLPGAMMVENAGGGDYPNNYEAKSDGYIEKMRERVEGLARVLAECTEGAVRIYYNDPVVVERFHEWYDAQGFDPNPFGRPMQVHNSLHDFHFHISIPDDLELLPMTPLPPGEEHPIQRIEEPPDPESAPNLASRNRNTAWREMQQERDDSTTGPAEDSGAATVSAMGAADSDTTAMDSTATEATPSPMREEPDPLGSHPSSMDGPPDFDPADMREGGAL